MPADIVVRNVSRLRAESGGGRRVHGSNGQRRIIGGGRADDARVRVGGGGIVAVRAAPAGGIGVACGDVQQNAALKNEKFPSREERLFTGGSVPEPAGNVRLFAALICTDKLFCYRTRKAKRLRIQTF